MDKIDKGGIHSHVYDCLDELWDEFEPEYLREYKLTGRIDWTGFVTQYWNKVQDEKEGKNGWYLIENYPAKKLEEWLNTFQKIKGKEMHKLHSS